MNQTKLDLSRYRTPELAEQLGGILSVPESVRMVLKTTWYLVLAIIAVHMVVHYFEETPFFTAAISSFYALIVAVGLGLLLGFLRVGATMLDRVERTLHLITEIALQAFDDSKGLKDGDVKMPSGPELMEHTYDAVISPTIDQVFGRSFGFIGKGLSWIYHRSIGNGVRMMIALKHGDEKLEEATEQAVHELAEMSPETERWLIRAQGETRVIADGTRKWVLRPLRFLFYGVAAFAFIPLVAIWWFSR